MSFDQNWAEDKAGGGAFRAQINAIAVDPRGLFRRRWLRMAIAFVIGILATATAFIVSLEPMFSSRATVLVSNQQIPGDSVHTTMARLDALPHIEEMTSEMLSSDNLGNLIKEYELYSEERSDIAFADVISLMRKNITIETARNVDDVNRVRENASTLSIQYVSSNPEIASLIANEVAVGFVDSSVRRNEQVIESTKRYERARASSKDVLPKAKAKEPEKKVVHREVKPMSREAILGTRHRLKADRQDLKGQISFENQRLKILRSIGGNKSLNEQDSQLADLMLALDAQLAIRTKGHPNVVALQQQIEELQAKLKDANLDQMRSELAHERQIANVLKSLEGLHREVAEIDAELMRLDQGGTPVPKSGSGAESLAQKLDTTDQGADRQVDEVAKATEELEKPAQLGPRLTILDHASPSTQSIHPSFRYVRLGLVASIGLAFLVALLAEFIDPMVLDPEHFSHIGNLPALGSIYTQ